MSLNATFHWPSGPEEVTVTGTFDNWAGTLPLVKQSSGEFELVVPLDPKEEKYLFKFIVDGSWLTSSDYEIANEDGNENNVIFSKNLATTAEETGSKIPESGGLATTVLPSQEGKQTTLGEPGVVIPENANEIDAFKQVSNVDAKALNEKLNGAQTEAAETTNVVIPAEPAAVKEFTEVSEVSAKDLNDKLKDEEPVTEATEATEEAVTEEKKKIKVKKVIKRNKETGEEIILSTEPVTEEAAAPVAEPVEEVKKETKPTPAPAKKPAKKEKKGFFSKLKKAFA